jgi:hypothetical protein
MSDLKLQYAHYMVDRMSAAIADGHPFSLRIKDASKWLDHSRIAKIELDAGAVVVTTSDGNVLAFRYDQLTRVQFGKHDED